MYINLHCHTDYSNVKFRDAISTVEGVMTYAKELGHIGCCYTEHENIASSMDAILTFSEKVEKAPEEWRDFKVLLGNEIYLAPKVAEGEKKVSYHFLLIAKDAIGHRQLRELSTRAWMENSYKRTFWITPTFYDDLKEVILSNPGHLIGSSACLGGYLAKMILENHSTGSNDYSDCEQWILGMKRLFGKDSFFLEMQPSNNEDQIIVNDQILVLSKKLDVPYIITTDAHYLKKEDRFAHKAFLTAQEAEREVDAFYMTTYLMSENEIHEYMDNYMSVDDVQRGIDNTVVIYNQCQQIDLRHPLDIPYIPSDIREPDEKLYDFFVTEMPSLEYFYNSEYDSDRHLVRDITERLVRDSEELQNKETYAAIEENLVAVKTASEKQHSQWSGYLLQTKELIKTCWNCDSLVGPSRGSGGGFILLYLLDIIQINPVREKAPLKYWRFLNPERVSPLDVDVDVCGYKRAEIVDALREEYGGYRHISGVLTLKREKSKSAIQTAMRGLGHNDDDAIYVSSFVKAERGIQFTLSQVFYGDEELGLKPDAEFVRLMTQDYPDVWAVAQKIENLICGVGAHAGGVILSQKDFVESTALMKTNSGIIITQFDLHRAESAGLIKWDLLGIDALEKIQCCLKLLAQDNQIIPRETLRETYMKFLGPYVIERNDSKMWGMLLEHKITSFFQMEKTTGYQAISIGQPHSVEDLSALNSVMRLMTPEGGSETPLERYGRFKQDISLWYKEMQDYGLTTAEIDIVRKYAERNYGLLPNQEDFMMIVQDPAVGGFDLLWADRLRKSVAKKNPKDYKILQEEFFNRAEEQNLSIALCHYVWDILISMNKGYGFNTAHTLSYSLIGVQEANLAYKYPTIYWNTANLIVDSGSLEENEDSGTKYGKMAAAIDNLRKHDQTVILPAINKAEYGFKPDVNTNEIIFAFKAIQGCSTELAKAIIANRPYDNFTDFLNKINMLKQNENIKWGDTTVINLIKAGCFDELENRPREDIMSDYIRQISQPLKSLSYSNLPRLKDLGLLTPEQEKYELRLYNFKQYVCSSQFFAYSTGKSANTKYYRLDHKFAEPYFFEHFESEMQENKDFAIDEQGYICVKKGSLDRVFDKLMLDFKKKVLCNPEVLNALNQNRFEILYQQKAPGTLSRWEMETLTYYFHDHELANVNNELYHIEDYFSLSETPKVTQTFLFKGKKCNRFELTRICGTVLDKDKNHESISLLTPTGLVIVKLQKGQFGFYDRRLSAIDEEKNTKTVAEEGWFKRGTLLMITGFRRGDQFVAKKYKDSIYRHSVSKIIKIEDDGLLSLQSERDFGEEDNKDG